MDKTSSCNTAAGASHVLHASASWDTALWNKPLTVTNARGYTTTLDYYASGSGASLLHTATRPAITEGTPVYTFTYDAKGKVVDATGSTGIVTHSTYQSNEDPKDTTFDYSTGSGHQNLKTQFAYDIDGNLWYAIDPRNYTTSSVYDADRRKTEDDHYDGNLFANLNAASKTVYDEIGRVLQDQAATAFSGTTVTSWLTTKTTTYTPTSKVETVTDADSRTTTTAYDDGDRILTVTDPVSRKVHYRYCVPGDANCAANQVKTEYRAWSSGNACSVTGSNQQCYRRVTYGLDGEEATVKDANGNTTTYTYDGFNRPYQTTFPDSTTETVPLTSGYDENGNVLQRTNRAGQTLTYSYNALDWTTQKVSPSPSVTTNWTYLLDGRIDTLSDNAGTGNTLDYGYDTAGRMTQVATKIPGISNKTITYQLDENGNRTKLAWPGSPSYAVSYCYDSLNRMTKALENATDCSSSTGLLASYTYNALSRRTNLTYGNGAQVQTPDPSSYSAAGDLLSLAHVFATGTGNNNTFTYSYTDAHQTSSIDASNTNWLWRPSATSTTGYTVNTLNQYKTVGSQTTGGTSCQGTAQGLSYDCNGNMTYDGTYTFTYDAENRLLTASKTGLAATYAYDPLGRRTRKSGTGVTETYYLSDGTDEIAEYDTSSNVINRFIPGPAIDEPIAQITGAGVKTFFHTDKQGSVVAMSDSTGAMIEGPYIYDAYGNCTSGGSACTVSATTSPYRFTGRRLDPETGLYYYRARYYDPKTGRFYQIDLVGYEADLNAYIYVGDDPVNRQDPTGLYDLMDPLWDGHLKAVMEMTPRQRATFAAAAAIAMVPAAYEVGGLLVAGPLLSAGISAEIASAKGKSAAEIGTSFVKGGAVAAATEITGFGVVGTMGVAGGTDFLAGVGLDLARTGNANFQENAEDAAAAALGAGAGKLISSAREGAGLGSVAGRLLLKKAVSSSVKNLANLSGSGSQERGSGRSANYGQTIETQGTRICPKDSSGDRPNSC